MKVYNKNDVDVTFSNQFMDLEQLTSFDAIPIPERATNGDIIKAMFPKIEVKPVIYLGKLVGYDIANLDDGTCAETYFTESWWNAPYKGVEE